MALKELRAVLADLDRDTAAGVEAAVLAQSLRAHFGLAPARIGPQSRTRGSKSRPVAEGSVGHRILEILRAADGPVGKKHIVLRAGARELDVALTIKELVADGRIQKSGVRAGTKYFLKKKGSAKK
jgi:hypothetical protein